MTLNEDLEHLKAKAKEKGATRAGIIPVSWIKVDPRARLKCIAPRCVNYGQKLLCPPNVPSLDEVKGYLSSYSMAILIQSPIPVPPEIIDRFSDGKEGDSREKQTDYWEPIKVSQREFNEMLYQVEREAFLLGYRFSAALGSEHCNLCDECVGNSGEPCRHPFKARPSMSAMGIDVFATSEMAGLPIEIPPKEHSWWTGLLLVD